MHLLVPEEFAEFAGLRDQIAPNEHLNAASGRFARSRLTSRATEASAVAGRLASRRRLANDFRFKDAQSILESAGRAGLITVEDNVPSSGTFRSSTRSRTYSRERRSARSRPLPDAPSEAVSVAFTRGRAGVLRRRH